MQEERSFVNQPASTPVKRQLFKDAEMPNAPMKKRKNSNLATDDEESAGTPRVLLHFPQAPSQHLSRETMILIDQLVAKRLQAFREHMEQEVLMMLKASELPPSHVLVAEILEKIKRYRM